MAATKRVQVLMDPAEFGRLEAIAAAQRVSLGELIRRAARERYLASADQRITAAEDICRSEIPFQAGDVAPTVTSSRALGLVSSPAPNPLPATAPDPAPVTAQAASPTKRRRDPT